MVRLVVFKMLKLVSGIFVYTIAGIDGIFEILFKQTLIFKNYQILNKQINKFHLNLIYSVV